ncbi:ABC transporter permease subunit [Rubripirellula sp.]|nr:ABC transporter permease subunit/CPBP intramembrane protease [Rubripirellula sp.]MDB4749515.1 ABC transporter permease subunit [Rubripirellula sp.]
MPGANLKGRLLRLCQKELRETIRDRRTIVTLLLMPLLVYPIMSMALNRFLLTSGEIDEGFTICVSSEVERKILDKWLSTPLSAPPKAIADSSGNELAKFRVTVIPDESPADAVARNDVDVGLELTDIETGTPTATLYAYRGDSVSQAARRVVVERLQWLKLAEAEIRLKQAISDYQTPLVINAEDVGTVDQNSLLATIVPLILVLMTITGAVYPAIDLTAGERERGTMEAVMASPVPRGYVLFSKYTAVVAVALLTAIANLVAMFTTLWAGGLLGLLTGGDTFPWITILQMLGLLVLFSGFFSAVLLSLTSFAKSFKEAQAYLIPVMLLSLTPAMLSLMPGITLSGALTILPLINIVLLARDLLSGTVDPNNAFVAIISTFAYAAAALSVAARLFGSDAVTRTSEKSIGSLLRRPRQTTLRPTAQAAALMLALLVPVYFLVSNGLMRFIKASQETSVEWTLLLNAIALISTFGLVPTLAAWMGRNRFKTTFRLQPSGFFSFLGAILLGLGAWAFAHEAFVIADAMGIGGLSDKQIAGAEATIAKMRETSPLLLIAVFALTPAVIEELCFRGYLFSAIRGAVSPLRTVVITALLFGLFHVLTGNALLVERFVPSTLMGLIIGWVAYRTGSVFPGIVIHFVHNGLLNMVLYYQDQLSFLGAGFDDKTHLPALWLAISASLVMSGALIIWASSRKNVPADFDRAGDLR